MNRIDTIPYATNLNTAIYTYTDDLLIQGKVEDAFGFLPFVNTLCQLHLISPSDMCAYAYTFFSALVEPTAEFETVESLNRTIPRDTYHSQRH